MDFVLVSGDLTDFGSDDEIRSVKKMLDSLRIPYHAIPGNHDAKWSESGCNTFAKVFGGEKFEFHAGQSPSDGAPLWGHKISLGLLNPISLLPDGTLLVSSMDGQVVRLRFPTTD